MSHTLAPAHQAAVASPALHARPRKLDTTEAADRLRVRPQTLRRALCLNGHYLGLRPTKLPNGRLLWDASAIEALTEGGTQ